MNSPPENILVCSHPVGTFVGAGGFDNSVSTFMDMCKEYKHMSALPLREFYNRGYVARGAHVDAALSPGEQHSSKLNKHHHL